MKKNIVVITLLLGLTACGGYSEEQGKAAMSMCDCMEKDTYGNYDINWLECDIEMKEMYEPEVFAEGSWIEALEDKCPSIAENLSE